MRLTGRVTRVGTLARASADHPFDDKRFNLVVELDETNAELRPEMTARADILLGNRPGVLLVPVNAVFDCQGVTVCHVVGRSGVETRQVQLGESSDLDVEVVAGLREGDRVAITDAVAAGTASGTVVPAPGFRSRTGSGSGSALSPR